MKESNPNFCTGVQILLSRMESNPEEFISGDKWYWIMSKVVDTKRNPTHHSNTLAELTPEEINALFDAYTPFLRKRFDDSVLREVLSSEEKELSYSVTSAPPAVLGNSPYAFGYANHTQHIALHQQALQMQAQQAQMAYEAQMAQNKIAGQGLLSSLFGGSK